MYLVKSGMIRLYKKKGDTQIELDTIHAGTVLGELAFLDGNPRSASAEALTECELVEISGPAFQEVLGKIPEWLKIMLKTVVSRLRVASTRIRQLETSSTSYDYGQDGKRSAQYVYLSNNDLLKSATAVLLVASRSTETAPAGIEIKPGLVQRYGNQVMGVPVAKLTSVLDVLSQAGLVQLGDAENPAKVYVKDVALLEKLIGYLNEENLKEPEKQCQLSLKGFLVMSYLSKHLMKSPEKYPMQKPVREEDVPFARVNVAEIRAAEQEAIGKDPFRMDEVAELAKWGFCSELDVKNNAETFIQLDPARFIVLYRFQKVVISTKALNEQKRKGGK